jgi:stage II sporulation protein AA (anti-sigma F factor antagonist)
MYLEFKNVKDKLIVRMFGELDHHSAEEVRIKIDDRIDVGKFKNLIMDFSGVTFMDSSGIGVVIGRYKKISQNDGNVFVAGVNESIGRVFELSGMYKIIKVFNSADEAVDNI